MAQRINISIPEELHAELEKYRDQLNVSGICQEALRKEVARLEAVATSAGDLDAVVKRLRAEKDEWENYWYEVGITLGHEWAKRAPYHQLVEWQRRDAPPDVISEVFGLYYGRAISREKAEQLTAIYPSLGQLYGKDLAGRGYNPVRLGAGWLKGVRDFWNQIKDAL